MTREDFEKVEKVLDTVQVGYAFVYPKDSGAEKEYLISITPDNLANFIGNHLKDAEKLVVTDMCDRLVLDTVGGLIDHCPNQELRWGIVAKLAPIQKGEAEAGEVIQVERDIADAFFDDEEEKVRMSEYGMM